MPSWQLKRQKRPAPRVGSGRYTTCCSRTSSISRKSSCWTAQLGLDLPRYRNEMRDHVYLQRVQEPLQSGRQLGMRSTPALYVNGQFTDVFFALQHLHQAIDKTLKPSLTVPPPFLSGRKP